MLTTDFSGTYDYERGEAEYAADSKQKGRVSPWRIIHDCPGYMVGYRAIVDEEGYTVVAPSPMNADYARLIAATPNMLAVLFLLVHGDGQPDEMPRIMSAARAALAKARGDE